MSLVVAFVLVFMVFVFRLFFGLFVCPLIYVCVYLCFSVGLISLIGRALSFCVGALVPHVMYAFGNSSTSFEASVLVECFSVPPILLTTAGCVADQYK